MSKLFTVMLLLLITGSSFAQQKATDDYFTNLRSNKSPNLPSEVYKPENAKLILNALPVYAKDTVVLIRSKATLIARVVGTKSTFLPAVGVFACGRCCHRAARSGVIV